MAETAGVASGSAGAGQAGAATAGQAGAPGYRLSVGTDVVVEDVSVTDKQGRPVVKLPEGAFHVLDDKRPQRVLSFSEGAEEGAVEGAEEARLPAGTYSNAALYRGAGPVVVMLLDPLGMSVAEQMQLRLQMLRSLQKMPEGTRVTVFRTNSEGLPVLLQSITTDRGRVIAAVNAGIPAFMRAGDQFGHGIAEVANIADYLQQVPGKKLLLWFAGTFPLFLDPSLCTAMSATINSVDCGSAEDAVKQAYRMLQQARIAVYPIDVRGVVVTAAGAGARQGANGGGGTGLAAEYQVEDETARVTGGRAYPSENDLAGAITEALSAGKSTYTLAYRPEPKHADGLWHAVKITVDGLPDVRYRTGYYAQPEGAAEPAGAGRAVLSRDGTIVPAAKDGSAPERPAAVAEMPIVFTAQVRADKEGKTSQVQISYSIPAGELVFQNAGGTAHARFKLIAFAYDAEGNLEGKAIDTVETRYTPAQMAIAQRIGAPAEQTVKLEKGARFLLVAVQDMGTQRVGTVQVPLRGLGQ